jgi:exodeoxyribonuclease V alpha subunit
MIELFGRIAKIRCRKESGWAVFDLSADRLIKCTGILPEMVEEGAEVTITGEEKESEWGKEIRCSQIVPAAPDVSTAEGVKRLLQHLPGIGPKKAAEAVAKHGHETAWLLAKTDPGAVGVLPADCAEAVELANSLEHDYAALIFFLGIGLTDYGTKTVVGYYKSIGFKPREIQTEFSSNPYRIMEIHGFGFKRSDSIALKSGVSPAHPARLAAAADSILSDSEQNGGNTWIFGSKLCHMTSKLLEESALKNGVPPGVIDLHAIRDSIYKLDREGKVCIDSEKRVFSSSLLKCEKEIFAAATELRR